MAQDLPRDILRESLNRASVHFLNTSADDFAQAPGLGLEFRYLCSRLKRTGKDLPDVTDKALDDLDDDGMRHLAKDLIYFIQKTKLPEYARILPNDFDAKFQKTMSTRNDVDEWEEDVEGD